MMIIDSDDFILTPICTYLEKMLEIAGYRYIPIDFQNTIVPILSTSLLQMTGFLEKKLDMIHWHIAQNDYEYRNSLIRNNNCITPNIKNINKIYNYLAENTVSKEMFVEEHTLLLDIHKKIISLFDCTHFINYTNSEFVEFKLFNIARINKSEMETLFEETYKYRHIVAHNINSVYKDHLSICDLDCNNTMYINFYSRFMILIFIDHILINKFESYKKNHNKIKWL